MPASQHWKADYYNGQTLQKHQAEVSIDEDGIRIKLWGGESDFWTFEEAALQDIPGQVVLEKGELPARKLVINDPSFRTALRQLSSNSKHRGSVLSDDHQHHLKLVLGFLLVCLVLLPSLYIWGVPWLSRITAQLTPTSVETQIADVAKNTLFSDHHACVSPEGSAALRQLSNLLLEGMQTPYSYEFTVLESETINAAALPGGQIIIFEGLLGQLESPEALAGILAHEIQHVEKRHGLQNLIRSSVLAMVFAVIAGDLSGLETVLDAVEVLSFLEYSRQFEWEADQSAAKMLVQKGIPLDGMIRFFEMLTEFQGEETSGLMAYLNTHPELQERADSLRAMQLKQEGPFTPVLEPKQWEALRSICYRDEG